MWILFVIFSIALYFWYFRSPKMPPGPRGIPLLGYSVFLGKNPERKIQNISKKKYGAIMSVRMGREDWVFLNNFKSVNQALVKQSTQFSGRSKFQLFDTEPYPHGLALLDYGKTFKSQRKFGLMTLRGFGVGKKGMENITLEEISYLNEEIRSKNRKAFDISVLLHNAISNNICHIVFGNRFSYNDPKFTEIMQKLISVFDDRVRAAMIKFILLAPILRFIPPFSYYYNLHVNDKKARLDWLRENVDEHLETFDKNNIRDFVDAFIAEMNKNEDSSFTKTQLVYYVRDLFIAGTATTASTLYWCLLCFLHYPQTQTKIREEIMKVMGSSGTPSLSHKPNMPYTNAFIQEIYRYRTIAPLSVPHVTTEEAIIDHYTIPKDTTVIANLWAVHNDPELFEEPEKFKPERFLDGKGNYIPSNHVIPFSVGPRHCLGEQLARMEVFIYLVGMVQKFEFLPDPEADQLPDIEDGSNASSYVALPYKLVAQEL